MTMRRKATASAAQRFGAAIAVLVLAAIVVAAPPAHSAPGHGDDTAAKQWRADPSEYQILVGRSSEDIQLRASITLPAVAAADANDK